jgi:antitoxin component YwqK of YwqJK toxin-antitoxin module
MKNVLVVAFCFFLCFELSGQWIKDDTLFYESGKIYRTSELDVQISTSDNWFFDFVYYYENGARMKEQVFDSAYGRPNRIMLMDFSLPDGTSLLTNGNGKFIEVGGDSAIYTVTNGEYAGPCSVYSHYTNWHTPWKLFATGNYSEGKRSGEWIFRDSSGTNSVIVTYENGIAHGNCARFYSATGILMEEGNMEDDERTGLWKKYDENGKLIAEYNYEHGQKMGACTLYYPDGKIKTKGQYTQLNIKYEKPKEDRNNPGTFVFDAKYHGPYVPAKTGLWYFYDEHGKLTKTKNYKDEIEGTEVCPKIW